MDLPVAFGRRHVVPLIDTFLADWPDVSIHATFTDRFVDLVGEGIDLCIRVGGETDNRLVSRVLAPNPFIICASPAYLKKHPAPKTPSQLDAHRCLTFSAAGRPLEWRFQEGQRSWSQPVASRLQLGNAEALRDAAISGAGLVQLDAYLVADDIRDGRLIQVLGSYATDGPPIRAVYANRRHLAPKVRYFIDAAASAWQRASWASMARTSR